MESWIIYDGNHVAAYESLKMLCEYANRSIQQLDRYNISRDSGKNTAACNKEEMVLGAFDMMSQEV